MKPERLHSVGPWKEDNVVPLFGRGQEPQPAPRPNSPDELLEDIDRRLDALIADLDAKLERLKR